MALQDTESIPGGYGQVILDWALGDDRIFTGSVTGLPITDGSLIDAYFTLKTDPTLPDSQAIVQVHITQLATPGGQITGLPAVDLLFHVYAGNYQSFVQAGTNYWWDFRVITTGLITWTIATGTVVFLQNATSINSSGVPGVPPAFDLRNNNIPMFRGWIDRRPDLIPGYAMVDVIGDFYRNLNPQPAQPSGWVCVSSGSPGTWTSDGIVGDIGSGV